MFGKKILSLIGLLFIGSQINGVFGTPIPKCTDEQKAVADSNPDCAVTGSYCFDDDNSKVYDYNGSDCKLVADGAFVIDSENSIIQLGTDPITDGQKYNLYYCDGSDCVATTGYVLNDRNYSLVKSGENAADASPENVDSATTCTGKVGKLVKVNGEGDAYLCLTQSKSVKLDDSSVGSYLSLNLGNFALAASPEDNTKVVITGKPNALVLNKLYTDDETHCYDASDASIMRRIDNFCDGTDCDNYYLCKNGVCTLQTKACPRENNGSEDVVNNDDTVQDTSCNPTTGANCEKGYYLYDSVLKVKDADEGTFYSCDGKKESPCSTDIPSLGYFINAAYDSEEAAQDPNHNAQYIKCTSTTAGSCTAYNAAAGECNKDGLVYSSGSDIFICLENEVPVKLNGSASQDTDYFINTSSEDNIFGAGGKYTLVNINAGIVTLSKTNDGNLYKYANDSYKVLTRGGGSVCNYDGKLHEFGLICSGETGYDNNVVYYEYKTSKTVKKNEN